MVHVFPIAGHLSHYCLNFPDSFLVYCDLHCSPKFFYRVQVRVVTRQVYDVNIFQPKQSFVWWTLCFGSLSWVPVKCETKQKRNETDRNETKQIETKRNRSKRNETNRNETKQNETKQIETKRNELYGTPNWD